MHLLGAPVLRRAGSQHGNRLSPGCATWHASNAQQLNRGRRQAALQLRSQIMGAQQLRLPTHRHLCRSRQSGCLVAAAKYQTHSFKDLLPPRLWGRHHRGFLSTATWLVAPFYIDTRFCVTGLCLPTVV